MIKNDKKTTNVDSIFGEALKAAVQTMSKKKQTEMISNHMYSKYEVLRRFRPLAIGIDKNLVAALPQFDSKLIARVLANHCRRPRYLKALAGGGKRFDLDNKPLGEVTVEEKAIATSHPFLQAKPVNLITEKSDEISVSSKNETEELEKNIIE